jgi:hypothetical protein
LSERVQRYNDNARRLEEVLADAPGVRAQARGRLATTQSYYSFVTLWDGPQVADVPMDRVHEALRAEGFACGGTYGAVRSHPLFNLKPKIDYRLGPGGCPVAEGPASKRVALFSHQWLGAPRKTIDQIGSIFVKVARQARSLK